MGSFGELIEIETGKRFDFSSLEEIPAVNNDGKRYGTNESHIPENATHFFQFDIIIYFYKLKGEPQLVVEEKKEGNEEEEVLGTA